MQNDYMDLFDKVCIEDSTWIAGYSFGNDKASVGQNNVFVLSFNYLCIIIAHIVQLKDNAYWWLKFSYISFLCN